MCIRDRERIYLGVLRDSESSEVLRVDGSWVIDRQPGLAVGVRERRADRGFVAVHLWRPGAFLWRRRLRMAGSAGWGKAMVRPRPASRPRGTNHPSASEHGPAVVRFLWCSGALVLPNKFLRCRSIRACPAGEARPDAPDRAETKDLSGRTRAPKRSSDREVMGH